MKTFNKQNLSEFLYRRETLPGRVRRIEEIASGRDQSFLPMITGKDGRVSEKKMTMLAGEMLQALNLYRESTHRTRRSDKQLQLYRYFLYNAMLCLRYLPDAAYYEMVYCKEWAFSERFADLTDLTEHITGWPSLQDLEDAELEDWSKDPVFVPGLFCSMKDTYQMVFGEHIAMLLPESRRDKAEESLWEEVSPGLEKEEARWEEEAKAAGFHSVEEYLEALSRQNEITLSERSKEEIEAEDAYIAFMDAVRKKGEKAKKAFLQQLGDREKWLHRYQRFRALYFSDETDVTLLAEDIRDAVDAFLFLHELSPFSYGDAYGLITNRLDRMTGQLAAEAIRAGRYV